MTTAGAAARFPAGAVSGSGPAGARARPGVQPRGQEPSRNGTGDAPARAFRPAPPFVYRTFTVVVRPDAVPEVIRAFEAIAAHARSERGTRLCAWFQSKQEPTRFLQVLVFDDERAERAHRESPPARQLAHMLESAAVACGTATEWNVLAGI